MRHEKPKSLEAAIVLFTDCIVSTNDYLEKSGQKEGVSTQKLVEGIFQNRLSKGTLSESGLSQQQIDKLRHFYIKQYFNGLCIWRKADQCAAAQMVLHCWKGMEDKNDNTNGAGCRE